MKRYIVANWKANKNLIGLKTWFSDFATPSLSEDREIILAPAYTLLAATKEDMPAGLHLSAQDVSPFPLGAYTGAVAAQQLTDFCIEYCLVGHSERREYFYETNADVAKKITELLAVNITPILCLDAPYIESQARLLSDKQRSAVLVAYEPRAAIGSGKPISVGHVEQVGDTIKQYFPSVPILYGGSVDSRNCSEFLLVTNGLLVGTASLEGREFAKIVAVCADH